MSKKYTLALFILLAILFGSLSYWTLIKNNKPTPFKRYDEVTSQSSYKNADPQVLQELQITARQELGISYERYLYCYDNTENCYTIQYGDLSSDSSKYPPTLVSLVEFSGYEAILKGLNKLTPEEVADLLGFNNYSISISQPLKDINSDKIVSIYNFDEPSKSITVTTNSENVIIGFELDPSMIEEDMYSQYVNYYDTILEKYPTSEIAITSELSPNINQKIKVYPSKGMVVVNVRRSFEKTFYIFEPAKEVSEQVLFNFIERDKPLIRSSIPDAIESSPLSRDD